MISTEPQRGRTKLAIFVAACFIAFVLVAMFQGERRDERAASLAPTANAYVSLQPADAALPHLEPLSDEPLRRSAVAEVSNVEPDAAPQTRESKPPAADPASFVSKGSIEVNVALGFGGVSGCRVSVRGLHGRWRSHSRTTDALGFTRVDELEPGRYEVQVGGALLSGRGAAYRVVEVRAGEQTTLVIAGGDREARIVGRVSAGGAPCAGRAVTVSMDREWVSTKTDGTGRFEAVLPNGGTVRFDFDGSEYAGPSEMHPVSDGETTSLEFDLPMGAVGGVLLLHDGKPAAGARVSLVILRYWDSWTSPRECPADAEGRFVFENLAAGQWMLAGGSPPLMSSADSVSIGHGDALYGSQAFEPFELGVSERRMNFTMRLPHPTSIRGSFPGTPGVFLVLARAAGTEEVLPAEIAGDRYRFVDLEPGTYEVFLATQPERARVVTLAEGDNLVVDFEFR